MSDWGRSYREEQEAKHRRNVILLSLIGTVVGIAVLTGGIMWLRAALFPVHVANTAIDTAYEVVDKVLDGDKAIKDYEWFKTQEAFIRQCLKNEDIAKEEWDQYRADLPEDREKWTRDDKTEENSLRNSYYALQKLTNKAIEDYNARASMVSRNIFKDNLPSNITRALLARGELTK